MGFAFVPARKQPAIDTLVPHEGGPGYSTTGTGADYAAMYGPLLDRRNLLLVDQRGTGLSRGVAVPRPAAAACCPTTSPRAGAAARSAIARTTTAPLRSADDLAAVIAKLELPSVSLYGDSYGTFFTQTFAGRHPEKIRSIVLDGAYPTYGESGWYPDPGAGDAGRVHQGLPAVVRSVDRPGGRSCRRCAPCCARCVATPGRGWPTTPRARAPR